MQNLELFKELINSPKKIIITTHQKPDADALGSSLALAGYLNKKGHSVVVITPTDYPSFLNWMPGHKDVIVFNEGNEAKSAKLIAEAELIFCLDFSALSRINEMGELIRKATGQKVLIDHHLEPEDFAQFKFWNPAAAATAQLIFELISLIGEKHLVDKSMAESLYAGIMTDTGSFRHPCTTRKVHEVVGELIEIGVNTSAVHRLIYDNNTEERMRFLGFALSERLTVMKDYNVAYFTISNQDLQKFKTKTGDTEGLVNYALSIEGVIMAAIIIDRGEAVKLSFRSAEPFSVNDLARKYFEGGGHKNAAGGTSKMSMDDTVQKFLNILPEYKNQLNDISKSINQHA